MTLTVRRFMAATICDPQGLVSSDAQGFVRPAVLTDMVYWPTLPSRGPREDADRRTSPAMGGLVDERYEIERELGRGGMGVVYLANDFRLRRHVAIKRISDAHQNDEELVARFQREAELLATIRHEHVVQIFAFCLDGPPAFVMEYVQGSTLGELLEDHARMRATIPVRRVLKIVRQIAGAIDAVHAAGLVHRDVKPDNLVIEQRTGRPVLIDFGLVAPVGGAAHAPRAYGTPQYMAPEMCPGAQELGALGSPTGKGADLYSLACTAFELLTGRPVFDNPVPSVVFVQQLTQRAPAPSTFREELAAFDAVFARALDKDPARRFATGADLATALEQAGSRWTRAVERGPTVRPTPSGDGAIHVLVVDDDDAFRRFSVRAAQLAFYRRDVDVRSVSSAEEALASARQVPPQLVLLDYSMPGIDGVETLAKLRELHDCAGTRVVVVSANAGAEQRSRFAVLGVTDFVEKPVQLRAFVDLIGRVLG